MNALIKNCRVASPGFELEGASVEMEGSRIKRIYVAGESLPDHDEVFNGEGLTAVPGFIDMHTHGAAGFYATDESDEAVAAIAACKLKEGVTSFLPTTVTLSKQTLASSLARVAAYMKKPSGAKVPGVHLEGPYINREWSGAQNLEFVRKPDIAEVLQLNSIAKVLDVSFAIEMEGGMAFTEELSAAGILPSCGHSGASFVQFQEARRRGLRCLTHFCNQMSRLHHRDIGLVGAGLYDDVMIEMICDKLHLSPEMIALAFKVKPLERIALITDSISASWMPDGQYSLGGLPVTVKNREARLSSNNALAGSTLRFNDALRNVCEISKLPLKDVIRTTSLNQALALGLDKLGKIEPGCFADIALLDKDFNVKQVFVDGVAKL